MTISHLVSIPIFLFGLLVGSFLNVCIWRLPAEEQVIRGRSRCRSCRQVIRWYDNIPILSFWLLRGKCRSCGVRISLQYPAVEGVTGLLFAALWFRFGPAALTLIYAVLGAALIVVSVIDAREMILPDEVTLPGLGLGLLVSCFFPALHGSRSGLQGLIQAGIGALAGGGFIWLMGVIGSWIFKKEAMGGGDVKLMAMVGSVVGIWKVFLVNLILAPLLGSVVGLLMKYRYDRDVIPYGPFLSLGTLLAIFWGDWVIAWYKASLYLTTR